jgi:alanine-synthesizing transaminase
VAECRPVATVFSRRVPAELAINAIAQARRTAKPRFDLTVTNPTSCGIAYPTGLLEPLGDPTGLVYEPSPSGALAAREAISHEYRRVGVAVDPDRIVLTASTSEAYSYLFKLLCDPNEAILTPAPSYPLFEHLARVEAIDVVPYRLEPDSHWRVDLDSVARAPERTRAVVLVHPNNPTGSFVHSDDARALRTLCARRGWALIVDEVFLDYALEADRVHGSSFAADDGVLTFVLGGLSKSVGLPQLKLGWIVAAGPKAEVGAALERLELIADTFLSVATPVQLALPRLLERGAAVRAAIQARCHENMATLRRLAGTAPLVDALPVGGGWSAVLRVPSVVSEEQLTIELLRGDSVAVHPGFFYDFEREGYLVVSLLPELELFATGVERLLARVAALA